MKTPNKRAHRVGTSAEEPVFGRRATDDHTRVLSDLFAEADSRFRQEVRSDGKLRRISETIDFSAESLFTSLMQIGLPAPVAIKVPSEIIPFLATTNVTNPDKLLTTADVRIAVIQALHSLEISGSFSRETISMWSAAYIRRYGNPSNQFVKVLDNGIEVDLNYEYLRHTVLPHLIKRILELPKTTDPFTKFGAVFSSAVVAGMAQEIIAAVNTLNLYSIRYKTLLNLLQDLVLEPPHPWMVSSHTISKVVEYNIERATHHFARIAAIPSRGSGSALRQSAEECVRHSAAAILAHYGAFLGVGNRYGLSELRRLLSLRSSNLQLWSQCKFHNIELDLRAMGSGVDALAGCVGSLQASFTTPSDRASVESWRVNTEFLYHTAEELTGIKHGPDESSKYRGVKYVRVTLTLGVSIDEARLLRFISDFLEYPGKIAVLAKETAPPKIHLKLSRHQGEQLLWSLRRGLLKAEQIVDVTLADQTSTSAIGSDNPGGAHYDVFLCHNSEDKTEVKRIGLWLRNHGLNPWLDEWELRPGFPWQRELESKIEQISSAAVFVGSSGFGPWQGVETEAFLRQFIERTLPVIPVILKSCNQNPKLPAFLKGMTWVDFRKRKPHPFNQLLFGIKGVRAEVRHHVV